MGMRELESAILREAREILNKRTLRMKDILEWSTGEVKANDGEVVVALPVLKVNVCVSKEHDRRKMGVDLVG